MEKVLCRCISSWKRLFAKMALCKGISTWNKKLFAKGFPFGKGSWQKDFPNWKRFLFVNIFSDGKGFLFPYHLGGMSDLEWQHVPFVIWKAFSLSCQDCMNTPSLQPTDMGRPEASALDHLAKLSCMLLLARACFGEVLPSWPGASCLLYPWDCQGDMAQRQRVWLQIRGLGVPISLSSLFDMYLATLTRHYGGVRLDVVPPPPPLASAAALAMPSPATVCGACARRPLGQGDPKTVWPSGCTSQRLVRTTPPTKKATKPKTR